MAGLLLLQSRLVVYASLLFLLLQPVLAEVVSDDNSSSNSRNIRGQSVAAGVSRKVTELMMQPLLLPSQLDLNATTEGSQLLGRQLEDDEEDDDSGNSNRTGSVATQRAHIKLDYLFFSDTDFTTMTPPTMSVYQALACQTDLFLTAILQPRLGKTVRLSLEVKEWSFDPTLEKPLSLYFCVRAFYEDGRELRPTDIIKAVGNCNFEDYVLNYVWMSYPIGGPSTEVLRYINQVAYDASVVLPDPRDPAPLLYDTTVCPALSMIQSTWQLGFFENADIMTPTREDFENLACQIHTFVDTVVTPQLYGTPVDITLQTLDWEFYPDDDFALNVTLDVGATVEHLDGTSSPIPSALIANMLKTSDLIDFIRNYVHLTPYASDDGSGSPWINVNRVRVESLVQDVPAAGASTTGWDSSSCPAARVDSQPEGVASVGAVTRPPEPQPVPDPEPLEPAPVEPASEQAPEPTPEPQPQPEPEPQAQPQPEPEPPTPSPSDPQPAEPQPTPTPAPRPVSAFLQACRAALFASDEDRNRHLNTVEYVNLINIIGNLEYEGYPFVALPLPLKINFDTWASQAANGEIELEAMLEEKSPLEQQQAHRDAICDDTKVALLEASASDGPTPVTLNIKTQFLAVTTNGVKTEDLFWDESEDIAPAFRSYIHDYVMNRVQTLLDGSSRHHNNLRRRQRMLSTDANNNQYWILPETAKLTGVKKIDCPADENVPKGAYCFQPSARYEIFALTPTPDNGGTNDISAAAHQATEEGIESGNLEAAIKQHNPDSVWGLAKATNTRPPTPSPVPVPTNPQRGGGFNYFDHDGLMEQQAQQPADQPQIVYVDDDQYADGEIVTTVDKTRQYSENQCGGDVAGKALNITGQDCNSFAGRHIWHIVVIVSLLAFLCLLFLPICIWGRYPCCCETPPKSMAKVVKARDAIRRRASGAVTYTSGRVNNLRQSINLGRGRTATARGMGHTSRTHLGETSRTHGLARTGRTHGRTHGTNRTNRSTSRGRSGNHSRLPRNNQRGYGRPRAQYF